MINKILLAASLAFMASAASTTAFADGHAKCDISKGRVNIIGNEFPAIQTIGGGAKACASDSVKVDANLTKEHKTIQVPGLTGNPAEYTVAIVANSSIVPLMNDGLLRPLDDLIAKHGQSFKDSQKITVDGKVMAIGFMANAQHFVFRKDVLEKNGVTPPKTYEEVLAACAKLKAAGIANPFGAAYSAGWGVGQEFNNMFIGAGGSFFKEGTAEPSVNSPEGIKALGMMKKLTGCMSPDFLTMNNNEINAEWKAGTLPMMQMWGSRAGPLLSGDGTAEGVAENTVLAGPLKIDAGSATTATTLWWDGWTIAANISDEDAEASYKAMNKAVDPSIMNDEVAAQAVWMIDGYKPTAASAGVFEAIKVGSTPYPMVPFQSLLHTALGAELPDFLSGKESAEKTLADVEAAYRTAAKEKGFLK